MALGNTLSGLMGGTPCTGVLVRTAVNVKSGANDKMSQFLNAIFVAITVFVLMPLFVYIPLPCIAAILITSACRLFPYNFMKELWRLDIAEFVNLLITAFVCIFVDGAFGLMVGGVFSILRTAIKSQKAQHVTTSVQDGILVCSVQGQVSYINAAQVEEELLDAIHKFDHEDDSSHRKVIDLRKVPFIDVDGVKVLETIFNRNKSTANKKENYNYIVSFVWSSYSSDAVIE